MEKGIKICVWHTGHQISDTVTLSLSRGLNADRRHVSDISRVSDYDIHIGYGILRGCTEVYRKAEKLGKHYFIADNGYFNPGHFTGNYRLSHQGTQCRWPGERVRLAVSPDALTLIAPPTADVCKFFGIDPVAWLREATTAYPNHKLRWKGDAAPLDWSNVEQLVTFNSSLGWQALERGIPVISNPQHSIVGNYYKVVDSKPQVVQSDVKPLFEYMRKHQFTLEQIEKGCAWALIRDYLST